MGYHPLDIPHFQHDKAPEYGPVGPNHEGLQTGYYQKMFFTT